jgi:hypothetical protein
MKHFYFSVLFTVISLMIFAQGENTDQPQSFRFSGFVPQTDQRQLAPPDLTQIKYLDEMDTKFGHPYRVGTCVGAAFDMQNSGEWTELPDHSGRIWSLNVTVKGAEALTPYYNRFHIPAGCALYIYNSNKKQVVGPLTAADNPITDYYASPMVAGESCTFEYFEAAGVTEAAQISVEEIGYIYRGAAMLDPDIPRYKSEACEVDVNCSEGTNWQDEKKGVCKLLTKIGSGTYYCSGSLMNNTSNDCTPYILTADHCSYDAGYATSTNLSQWMFYFHYESLTCGGTYTTGQKTKVGCTLKAHDTYGSNNTGSDFYLVQLNTTLTAADNIYYNGWSRSTTASASGVGIHHPAGDIMKISTYTAALTSLYVGAPGSHWGVVWAATTNGHGVTEGGSSGSPLFNASGQVIGTLTGGGSSCSATSAQDYYGKFSYHWATNGTTSDKQLKPWLDPTNTGATTLNGSASCTPSSIRDAEKLDALIHLYPNPASGYIHVALGDQQLNNVIIRIYSELGPLVMEKTFSGTQSGEILIDITGQPSGLYFMSLESENKVLNKKIMILQ